MSGCLHSFTSGIAWPKEVDSGQFNFGNAVHDVAEAAARLEHVDVPAIAKARGLSAPDARRLGSVAATVVDRINDLIADGWMLWPEVAVAYNPTTDTARVMRKANHRDYGDSRPGEYAATLDLIAVRPGELAVWDWKSGVFKYLDGASWQLRFGGLAVARIFGAADVAISLLYVGEDGIREDPAAMDYFSLTDAADGLRKLWADLHQGPTAPVRGVHCTKHYCKLVGRCSATRDALVQVETSHPLLGALASPAQIANAWDAIPLAEATIKAVKEELRAMAANGPVTLPGGRRLAMVESQRETVNLAAPGAYAAVVQHLGQEATENAVTLSIGKGELVEAARAKAPRGKKDAAERAVLDALRAVGGLVTSRYEKLTEHSENKKAG
jgi:hypothetical protein